MRKRRCNSTSFKEDSVQLSKKEGEYSLSDAAWVLQVEPSASIYPIHSVKGHNVTFFDRASKTDSSSEDEMLKRYWTKKDN